MSKKSLGTIIGNGFMKAILHSPLHKMLSSMTLVIYFTGRSSGNPISTPVNFAREGKNIYITSTRDRHWWRNLRGGATVQVLLDGKKYEGWAETIELPSLVGKHLATIFRLTPAYTKYFDVEIKENGLPDPVQLKNAASDRIGVLVRLN